MNKKIRRLNEAIKCCEDFGIHVSVLENGNQKKQANKKTIKYYEGYYTTISVKYQGKESMGLVWGIDGVIGFLQGLTFFQENS